VADIITPKLHLTKPEVGGSDDTWGEKVNGNFDLIDAAVTLNPADKPYVDAQDSLRVLKAGDVMGGFLTLNADPTSNLHAATKHYVDTATPPADWNNITNKPATFPPTLPIAQSGVTNLVTDLTAKAPLASPVFTGNPTAPTPAIADNDTSIATTAFIKAQNYAPIDSPVFTGNAQAPNPPVGDNDASIATTQFVTDMVIAAGSTSPSNANPLMDGVAAPGTSLLYARGDHVHPSDTTKQPLITAGTTAQYWRGDKTFQTLDKAAVGLGNVDNTSDANKPVSTAQAAADNLRVLKAGDTMTGQLIMSYAAPGAGFWFNTPTVAQKYFLGTETGTENFRLFVSPVGQAISVNNTGFVTLIGDPTAALGAVTKQYADKKVLKTGDTMTGQLAMSGAPATINAPQKGHLFGTPAGTAYNGAVQITDANIILYGVGNNWCGFGTDTNGSFWLRAGLSGTPVPQLRVNSSTGQVETSNTPRKMIVYTSGSGTYTPTAGCIAIRVRLAGGGAGGQGGGTTHGAGGAGGTTTLGPYGATGGNSISPGTGSGGQLNLTGGQGPYPTNANLEQTGAMGAVNPFGGGGAGIAFYNAGGAGSPNTGAGGAGGGCDSAVAGAQPGAGGGAGGYCEAIAAPPAANYAYAVGVGGTGGGFGASGKFGGNGGSGVIIIEEFFL
jgi:hypothetical protein